MKRFVFLMAAIAFCLPATAFAQQPPISRTNQTAAAANKPSGPTVIPSGKIAVIDSGVFPTAIEEYKSQVKKLETEFGPRQKDLEALQTRYQKIVDEVNQGGSMMAKDALTKKTEEAAALEKEIKRKGEDLQADVEKRKQQVLTPLSEKVFRFLENYAQGRNIVVIFDLAVNGQVPIIISVGAGSNITDDFVKEYNKANPVAAAPPSPAPNK